MTVLSPVYRFRSSYKSSVRPHLKNSTDFQILHEKQDIRAVDRSGRDSGWFLNTSLVHILLILIICTTLNQNTFKVVRHSLSILDTLSEDYEEWENKYKEAKVMRRNVPEKTAIINTPTPPEKICLHCSPASKIRLAIFCLAIGIHFAILLYVMLRKSIKSSLQFVCLFNERFNMYIVENNYFWNWEWWLEKQKELICCLLKLGFTTDPYLCEVFPVSTKLSIWIR